MNKSEAQHIVFLQSELKSFVKEMDNKYKGMEVKCKTFPDNDCFIFNVNCNAGYFRFVVRVVDRVYGTYSYESVLYDEIIW